MGKWLAGSATLILATLATGNPQLHAEEFPWCVKMDVFTTNCAFANYNECALVARNGGGACIHNPKFRGDAENSKSAAKTSNKQR